MVSIRVYMLVCMHVCVCVVNDNEMHAHTHIIIEYGLGSGCNVCKCVFHSLSDDNVIL